MPTRNYQHANRSNRKVQSPTSVRFGPRPTYSNLRRAYQRGAKGKFDLKSATREQITDLRNRIIARRIQRMTIGIIIILVLLTLAVFGVRYIMTEYSEAQQEVIDETGYIYDSQKRDLEIIVLPLLPMSLI